MRRPPMKRIARLLARHNKEMARGKARFEKASQALQSALSLGALCGQPVELPGGGTYVVNDNFTSRDVVYRPARFCRFSVDPYKAPRKDTATKSAPAEPATTPQAEVPAP